MFRRDYKLKLHLMMKHKENISSYSNSHFDNNG